MTGAGAATWWSRQHLTEPFTGELVELVEQVAGLNAQTARGPAVGIRARTGSCDLDELDALRRDYRLVEVNVMRGTVHLITARQYRAWRPALGPTLRRNVAGFCRGIWDAVDHDDLVGWGTELICERGPMTRGELGEAAAPRYPRADPAHLGFALRMVLPVVEVPTGTTWRPGRTTYVLADAVLDEPCVDAATGLVDLATAYVRAFGSAEAADLAAWSGMTRAEAREALDRVEPGVIEAAADDVADGPTVVLPEFDNVYFCRHRSEHPLHRAKKDPRIPRAAALPGTILTDGEVVGTWKHTQATGLQRSPWSEWTTATETAWDSFSRWYDEAGST